MNAGEMKIVELAKNDAYPERLISRYSTPSYYDLSICRGIGFWKMELVLTPMEEVREKTFEDRLFEDHVEEPRVFAALVNNKQVGWIELGFHKWNNRMRVWEFLVEEEFRRRGIGTLLMKHATKIAKEKGARMLVLETQTCNVPEISFYLKFGFELVGFDATAYSNEDIEKKEVRLELGFRL
ncbi:GNAT family N-acetyltransferase [Candidatus Bathyarchaeota archaeon]|nr:GNAT family N-acetyltransferase [Candidatus Bathyarchaeota archaeon]